MAGIRHFNPTEWHLEAEAQARGLGVDRSMDPSEIGEWFRRRNEVQQELTEQGVYDPYADVARLMASTTPSAHRKLSLQLFGLYDEHHAVIALEGKAVWAQVAIGRLGRIVPPVVDA